MRKAFSGGGRAGRREARTSAKRAGLDLFRFVPFRLNRLAAEVSAALSSEYRTRYGLDIPEWRVLATLGFRDDACSAQYIAHCTRTHKSTISRAVTALLSRQLVERIENEEDRREYRLRMTRQGRTLYRQLIPRLKRREKQIMSCLSAREARGFRAPARQDREQPRSGADQPGGRGERNVLALNPHMTSRPSRAYRAHARAPHFAAVTTISTMCGGSRSTPRQARIGGLLRSTHSSQARFISPFRPMSPI